MIIIKAPWIGRFKTVATTVYPFIFISSDRFFVDETNLRHEKIHARQQIEMLIIPFFIWYFTEYAIRAMAIGWAKAYYKISFEQEAYANEKDFSYLYKRKLFSWTKYI